MALIIPFGLCVIIAFKVIFQSRSSDGTFKFAYDVKYSCLVGQVLNSMISSKLCYIMSWDYNGLATIFIFDHSMVQQLVAFMPQIDAHAVSALHFHALVLWFGCIISIYFTVVSCMVSSLDMV
jgi:hypothetical protein